MLDSVEPIGLPNASLNINLLVCPKCPTGFIPKRSNQKYCSRLCSKAATRNNSRGCRKDENKRMNKAHYVLVQGLEWWIYNTAPNMRLTMMKTILGLATRDKGVRPPLKFAVIQSSIGLAKPTPANIRRVLTDPKLHKEPPRADNRMNIAKAASAYTMMFFGVSIKTYLKQAREGTLNENHPVTRLVKHKAVPKLTKIKKVRCWHCPLPTDVMEANARRFDEDMARIDAIVTKSQADMYAYIATQVQPPTKT